jgi:hypothetical protein
VWSEAGGWHGQVFLVLVFLSSWYQNHLYRRVLQAKVRCEPDGQEFLPITSRLAIARPILQRRSKIIVKYRIPIDIGSTFYDTFQMENRNGDLFYLNGALILAVHANGVTKQENKPQ